MGSRGAGSGRKGSGGGNYKNSPEYKEMYDFEVQIRQQDAAVPAALSSNINNSDEFIETQMRGYASAIGDPIKAMERQRATIANQYEDFKAAKSNSDLGTRDAMKRILDEYDEGIERMKRVKKNSKRPDLL